MISYLLFLFCLCGLLFVILLDIKFNNSLVQYEALWITLYRITTMLVSLGMADFQYLASHNGPDGNQISLYDKIILHKPEKKEFYDNPVPLFIPPPIFSRLDTAVDYYYRPDVHHR